MDLHSSSVGAPPAQAGHHIAGGFRNNYPSGWKRESVWRWQWERLTKGVMPPPPGGWRFPCRQPDAVWLAANRIQQSLTWLGHATFLLQLSGINVLTDPHLSPRASPFSFMGPRRWVAPPLQASQLPHIDLVLISHNHYDHLDEATVRQLLQQPGGPPQFLVPLGLRRWFNARRISGVDELDWWNALKFKSLTATFTPAQHWSGRGLWDRNRSLWGGWRLDGENGSSFFFAGDTGYSRDFLEIRARLGAVDLTALPIGAYAPRWFMAASHVDPEEAVQMHLDLGARRSVAMHWGTFVLTDEPLDEPPLRLYRALERRGLSLSDFDVWEHGETRILPVK